MNRRPVPTQSILNRAISKATLLFAIFALSGSLSAALPGEEILPAKHHGYLGKLITQVLAQYHYVHPELDDSMSTQIFDNYIDKLDGNHYYFLKSHVDAFEPLRFNLDDAVKDTDVEQLYKIFNAFKARIEPRMAKIRTVLEDEFDYSKDEFHNVDYDNITWSTTEEELDERWRLRLKSESLNLKLAGKEETAIDSMLVKRYENFERRINQYDSEEIFELFMNSLTESFDPHTNYFSPINSDNFNIRMSLSYEGIGARLVPENEYTKIFEVIVGGPAAMDGRLQAGDYIVGVDRDNDGSFIDVVGMKLDSVVQHIRGKRNSKVSLQVIPGGAVESGEKKVITLVRDKVKLEEQEAKSDTLQIQVGDELMTFGVIDIPKFYVDFEAMQRREKDYKSTTRDVKKLISDLKEQNVDGIIVDLRDNGGGSLQEAIELTGLFIDRGPVVQTKDTRGEIEVNSDPEMGVHYDGPLAVLVNRLSASASEIFAGAIQDYGRGVVIGNQSYGKGTVQQLISLNNPYFRRRVIQGDSDAKLGRVKVTMAKFYRVTGASTQHMGVIPDIVFPSRFDVLEYGENHQVNALLWDKIKSSRYKKVADLSAVIPKLAQNYKIRAAANPEFKFLAEDITELQESRKKISISLNEEQRKTERKENETMRKTRDRERRVARGLDPDGDDDLGDRKSRDFILKESAFILADFIGFEKNGLVSSSDSPEFKVNNNR